jgi:hypothetical protein
MLSVIMVNVIMLCVVSVVMLNVDIICLLELEHRVDVLTA